MIGKDEINKLLGLWVREDFCALHGGILQKEAGRCENIYGGGEGTVLGGLGAA